MGAQSTRAVYAVYIKGNNTAKAQDMVDAAWHYDFGQTLGW